MFLNVIPGNVIPGSHLRISQPLKLKITWKKAHCCINFKCFMQGVDEFCCCDRMFLLWSVDWGGVAYLCHGPDFTSLYNLVLSDLPACASGFSSVKRDNDRPLS